MMKTQLVALSLAVISLGAHAQTINVKGVVSASTTPVRYASVTFTDKSDAARTFTALTDTAGRYQIGIITSAKPTGNLPTSLELDQNYPNPFVSSTAIPYTLKAPSSVQVSIYDILGREVKRFTVGQQAAGAHGILWSGINNAGARVAPGVYFYRLEAGGKSQVRKMILGAGGNGALVSVPRTSHLPTRAAAGERAALLEGGTFVVEIANTDSTFPVITAQQFDDVVILGDTACDFAVTMKDAATISLDSTQQTIRGFGGVNMPGWIADMTTGQVNTAFGTGTGQLGLTILRVRVPYDSTKFNLEVPTAALAKSLGAKIIASPWTPPAWMKSNNNIVGGTLKESSYGAYAAHLKSFVDYMSNHGAALYAVSIQNEPDVTVTYESCDWNATQMITFIKNNALSIGSGIIAPESFNFDHSFSDSILNDPAAAVNVAIIGGHIYGGGLTSYPLAASKGKDLWMTEHLVVDTIWSGAFATAKEINDCMVAGMNAYVWWYIRRFYGPIDDNSNVTKRGYVMSQYARFVRPGFTRVSATATPRTNVSVTAYTDGSTVVIVALNASSSSIEQTFTIPNGTVSTFTPYVTSSAKNCVQGSAIPVSSGAFSATLDPSSVTTLVSN